MTIDGLFRGSRVAIRLTAQEYKLFRRAKRRGFLVRCGRPGSLDYAWEAYCGLRFLPCVILRMGRRTANLTLDLASAGLRLDEAAQRVIRVLLFKASCLAPNPASKGRMRRRIITPTHVYARVPLACAEETAIAVFHAAPEW